MREVSSVFVVIVADNASEKFGGESLLPLQYFRRLRRRGVECWLVTHARVRAELDSLLGDDAGRVCYVEDTGLHKALFAVSKVLPRRIAQATCGVAMTLLTQVAARGVILRLVQQNGVNVVHQPAPVSPRAPSAFAGLGIPVIIGPMNGGMEYPLAFRGAESWFTRGFVMVTRGASTVTHMVLRGKREAAVLLAANERTRAVLPENPGGRVVVLVENAVDLTLWQPRREEEIAAATFVYVGRLVDWKRVDLLLRAVALVPEATLELLGDGDQRGALEALAASLGVSGRVRFRGFQPQAVCAEAMRGATALVLASIYESGGAVVLEAMAVGVPAIVTAWGGPVDYVDASCGVLVPVDSEESIVSGFAEAMRRLSADPKLVASMGAAGRARVEREFDWEKKVDQMEAVYASVIRGKV